jgi:lipopolysaccharide transport system permease protein
MHGKKQSSREARLGGYLTEIWRLRHFWLALVRVDLKKRYRRSVIGIGWSLLHPIAMSAVLCVVFSHVWHLPIREFAPGLLVGLTFWGFMLAVVMQGCQSFFHGESYIRQHPAPLAIYPLRTTLAAGFHFALGFGVAMFFVWMLNGFGNLLALAALVPAFALLFIVGWSLAVCMGVANVLFQDSQHLIEVFMQMAFYLTPIIYPPEVMLQRLRPLGVPWLINLNPFAVWLELIRRPLVEGQMPSTAAIGCGAGFALLVAGMAVATLKHFEKRMIFYL